MGRLVWGLKAGCSTVGWISGNASTIVNHLRACALVDEVTRNRAQLYKHGDAATPYTMPTPIEPLAVPGPSAFVDITSPPRNLPRLVIPQSHALSPHTAYDSHPQSLASGSSGSLSPLPIFPTQSPFPVSSALPTHAPPSAMRRSFSLPATHFELPSPQISFSPDRQAWFETRICRLLALAGLPLSFTSNLEWIALVNEFLPGVRNVKCDALTRCVLPCTVDNLRQQAKIRAKGCDATLQSDGWSGMNAHHLVAFMIAVDMRVSA
jgi:hypothetical protein